MQTASFVWRTHLAKTAFSSALQFWETIWNTCYGDLIFRDQVSTKGCLRNMSYFPLREASVLKTKQHDKTQQKSTLLMNLSSTFLVTCLREKIPCSCLASALRVPLARMLPLLRLHHTPQTECTAWSLNIVQVPGGQLNKFFCGEPLNAQVPMPPRPGVNHQPWAWWELLGRTEIVVAAEARAVTFIWHIVTWFLWERVQSLARWHCDCKVLIL